MSEKQKDQKTKCPNCNFEITGAEGTAKVKEFAGKAVVEVYIDCPACSKSYLNLFDPSEMINDESQSLIVNVDSHD